MPDILLVRGGVGAEDAVASLSN